MDGVVAQTLARGGRGPYGKSCTNCSRVKYKCVWLADGICERCQRLKKDCQSIVSVRKRNKTATSEKAAPVPCLVHSAETQASLSAVPKLLQSSFDPALLNLDALIDGYNLSGDMAEERLATFRSIFLPAFPFVSLPPELSSIELRRAKPFLWLVIMSLTTKSSIQQLAMGEIIREIMAKRVVVGCEKSLDLLLGIICYMGWFQFHKKDKTYLVMWTQIAVSMMFELGLNKQPLSFPEMQDNGGQFSSTLTHFPPRMPPYRQRTLEDRRTVIAVWLISSMVWTSLRQAEPFRFTAFMEESLHLLEEEKQTELDSLLVFQAKAHQIINRITSASVEEDEAANQLPPYFTKAVLLQLQELRNSMSAALNLNTTAQLYLQSAEILAREGSLRRTSAAPNPKNSLPNLSRLEALEALLTSLSRYFELYRSFPMATRVCTSFAICAQYSHATILLFRLSTLNEPGWDLAHVHATESILTMLDRSIDSFEEFLRTHEYIDDAPEDESGVLFKAPKMLRMVRGNFAKEIGTNISKEWITVGSESDGERIMDMAGLGCASANAGGSAEGITGGISDEDWELMQMSTQDLGLFLQEDPLNVKDTVASAAIGRSFCGALNV
ncbi:hypothetical protein EJ04DRAFT_530247 [Polyplosphaeria fusca]|uniref:Zn(2)-C6 fungal-type domain-containing protein n=1 Tax=Polyplosphaeria fusca TaxID=682080 RepID=A0A9P4QFR6_9PLEO|nr:hypothetical protein EJ04DRAFT_530247 [Polyplosphaeria fusca]